MSKQPSDPKDMPDRYDAIIIGGGGAGLGAALQLARSRRSVLVLDAGEPRNAPATHMHSYLGHDGLPPGEFLAIARDEVTGYGAEIVSARVARVDGDRGSGFVATLDDGRRVQGRRVVLATGLADELPDIPGVADQWGRGVLHCPFCHGWEVRDQRLVLIATSEMAAHVAGLFRQLSGNVTIVLHSADRRPEPESLARLERHGVRIVDTPVDEVVSDGDLLVGVRLTDGTMIAADAVVVSPRMVARAEAVASLGVETTSNQMGEFIETDEMRSTTVPGVYAVGNVADLSHQVLQAAADGARTGAMINGELVNEDLDADPEQS